MSDLAAKVAEAKAALAAAGDTATAEIKSAVGAAEAAYKAYSPTTRHGSGSGTSPAGCSVFRSRSSVTIVVSLFTTAPSKEMQDFIDSVRVPRGGVAAAHRPRSPRINGSISAVLPCRVLARALHYSFAWSSEQRVRTARLANYVLGILVLSHSELRRRAGDVYADRPLLLFTCVSARRIQLHLARVSASSPTGRWSRPPASSRHAYVMPALLPLIGAFWLFVLGTSTMSSWRMPARRRRLGLP